MQSSEHPAKRALSQRALNRALLDRQLLLRREALSIPEGLTRTAGLQAQYAPAMYVGLWSRLHGFERAALTRALEDRSVVQGTLMRGTIHVVAAADYWPFALAIRHPRRRWWLSSVRGPLAPHMAAAARQLRRHIGDQAMHRTEIEALIGKHRFSGVGLWVDLVRAPPSGTWDHPRASLYAAADAWLPQPRQTPAEALEHLVTSYLRAFGPAAPADIASWAGLRTADLGPTLRHMDFAEYTDAEGDELIDVDDGALPDPDTPAPIRFLPVWDATLLQHARRAGIVAEEHREQVFTTKHPQGTATFLVDGAVAGAWHHEEGRIVLEPFIELDKPTRRALDEEAQALAAFYAEAPASTPT